ncbi:hypothetical protein BDR05DRAFT_859444, partial [Suillus weaverae]
SNNSQLPITIQLTVFLNGIGHYGNAATTEDIADWAGVSVETVYNCYKHMMIMILQLHDQAIHFDLLNLRAGKTYVEKRTCPEWCSGFLCADGTSSPLYEKLSWHKAGFFDKNSNYSLTDQ